METGWKLKDSEISEEIRLHFKDLGFRFAGQTKVLQIFANG